MDAVMEEQVQVEVSAPMEELPAPVELVQAEPQPPPQEAPTPVAKRLEGIVELMQRVNLLLEELSRERRAEVSSKQWETWEEFKSSPARGLKPAKFWQNSIFARIYFVDKDLDECFHNVIKHESLFFNHLNSLYIKTQFRSEGPPSNKRAEEDPSSEAVLVGDPQASEMTVAAGDASNQQPSVEQASRTAEKIKDIEIIKQSFVNLIKAKIEFDTQFLNFNGILSKNAFPDDIPDLSGNAKMLLGQTALAAEHRKATGGNRNKRLRRKSVFGNIGEKSRNRLRRSARIASEEDSGEVQIIRSLRRRDAE